MSSGVTMRLVHLQATAMKVDMFEVGAYKPAGGFSGSVEPEMLLRTWDTDTLLRSVNWLRLQNLNGRNIYIRPKGEHPLTLLDDLTFEALDRMKAEGFHPSVVVETSFGNFQAWINHGEVLPKEISTKAARVLSNRFAGDPSSADWRHFGRLAGFTNRKEKYRDAHGRSPFVKLIEVTGSVYPQAQQFLSELRAACELANRRFERIRNTDDHKPAGSLRTIAQFRRRPEYQNDGNRIDMAYAVYALSHGVPEDEVRAAIATRDLSHKGNERRQFDYLDRTVKKAWASVHQRSLER
jgi:hypothetical protein